MLAVGCDPILGVSEFDQPAIGELGTLYAHGWATGPAEWCICDTCGAHAIKSCWHSFRCRPCGHYDDNAYMGTPRKNVITRAWREAGNGTQWNAPPGSQKHWSGTKWPW